MGGPYGLNPLSIGSVFPTGTRTRFARLSVLIPFLSGLFFQRRQEVTGLLGGVLIPFLSGLFFQRRTATNSIHQPRLNPLSIGSVFPTPEVVKGSGKPAS